MSNALKELREALSREQQLAKLKARLVSRLVQIGDCWIYRGERNPSHYGVFRVGDKVMTASRFALCVATNTPFDYPFDACHVRTCASRACCNPGHLFWGSHGANIKQRDLERGEFQPWLWPKWTPQHPGNPEPPTDTGIARIAVPMWNISDTIGSTSALSRQLLCKN